MIQTQVKIRIPTASDKLKQNFPLDPKGDVQIIFKTKTFKLQKAHLRLQSSYFKKALTSQRSILQINEDFDEQIFSDILLCFYGATLEISRQEILNYYPILQFLEVQSLIQIMRMDMVQNVSEYNFFELFDLAYRYSDQQIFQKCLLQMQYQDFLQIKNDRENLLNVTQELFKLIVKAHDRLKKSKRALNVCEINNLISEYCYLHNFSIDHSNNMKFQLIDKHNLTSQEYQEIFLLNDSFQQTKSEHILMKAQMKTTSAFFPMKSEGDIPISSLDGNIKMASMTLNSHKFFQLQMDITFQKKISQELMMQKSKLLNELNSLNDQTVNQNQVSKTIKQDLTMLKKEMDQKQNESKFLSKKISSIGSDLSSMSKNLSAQSEKLKKLSGHMRQMLGKKDKQEESKDSFSQASSLHDFKYEEEFNTNFVMIKGQNQAYRSPLSLSKSNDEYTNKSQLQTQTRHTCPNIIIQPCKRNEFDFYLQESRVQFTQKSRIIDNLQELQSFASLITDYTKLKLNLIFQASKNSKEIQQVAENLRSKTKGKKNLLFLFRTETDKLVGGFVSVQLDLYSQGNIQDRDAYIFSVTQGKKFYVKRESKQEAIIIDQGYIICFGTDLMISDNLFEMQNYCDWPSIYQSNEEIKQRGSDWLVGDSQFSIRQIECYEINDDAWQEISA